MKYLILFCFLIVNTITFGQNTVFRATEVSEKSFDSEVRSLINKFNFGQSKQSTKSYIVSIDSKIFNSKTISFEIDNKIITAELLDQDIRNGESNFTWYGKTNDDEGVFFNVINNQVSSSFYMLETNYLLIPISENNKKHILLETNIQNENFECGVDDHQNKGLQKIFSPPFLPPPLLTTEDSNCTLRLLVATTPNLRSRFNDFQIRTIVNNQIAWANLAYMMSEIDMRIELAVIVQTNYIEDTNPGNIFKDIDNFREGNGALRLAHQYRELYETDLNILYTNSVTPNSEGGTTVGVANGVEGIPFLSSAEDKSFSVLGQRGVTNNVVFTHELGHSMGAFHQNDNVNPDYARAITDLPLPSRSNTIMADILGLNLQNFSNPNVSVSGVTLGTSSRDNARRINNIDQFIKSYRIVPNHKLLNNELISSGYTSNHLGKLSVKNNGNTVEYSNGSVGSIRSGNEIILSPGVLIREGSQLRVFIDQESCIISSGVSTQKTSEGFESEKKFNITLYPNPTTGLFSINNEDLNIVDWEIYNQFGVSELKNREKSILSKTLTIDISNERTGIYFIQLLLKSGEVVSKSIIKK